MHEPRIEGTITNIAFGIDDDIADRSGSVDRLWHAEGRGHRAIWVCYKYGDPVRDDWLRAIARDHDKLCSLREIRLICQIVKQKLVFEASSEQDHSSLPNMWGTGNRRSLLA